MTTNYNNIQFVQDATRSPRPFTFFLGNKSGDTHVTIFSKTDEKLTKMRQVPQTYTKINILDKSPYTLYFKLCTWTRLPRPFVKSGFLSGREAQVAVQFWSK